jgi:hypothetical protein
MRSTAILLAMIFLFAAAPALAQSEQPAGRAQLLARLAAAVLEKAGITLRGDENELRPTLVDGTGNTVFNIDELVINFNVGDVSIEKEFSGGGPAAQGAQRLVDLLMQRLDERDKFRDQERRERPGYAVIPPPYSNMPLRNRVNKNIQTHSGWDAQYRQESRRERAEDEKREDADRERERPWMQEHRGRGGEFRGPAAAGEVEPPPGPNPAVRELLLQIPPDVEPEFVEFIMHVGRLAREHPRFRAALEKMVERAEAQMAEAMAEHRE